MSSRERVYYVYDIETEDKVAKRDYMQDAFSIAKKENRKVGLRKYSVKGGWVIHR